jgi:Fe-S-cluster-containing hydrogenase component 2
MEAVQLVNEKASIDIDKCIGCGLCVSTCPTDSMTLVRKPDSEQSNVPQDIIKASIELGRTRGKLNLGNLLMMQVRSKVDRLLASK